VGLAPPLLFTKTFRANIRDIFEITAVVNYIFLRVQKMVRCIAPYKPFMAFVVRYLDLSTSLRSAQDDKENNCVNQCESVPEIN
jgi:hypothetical protein